MSSVNTDEVETCSQSVDAELAVVLLDYGFDFDAHGVIDTDFMFSLKAFHPNFVVGRVGVELDGF